MTTSIVYNPTQLANVNILNAITNIPSIDWKFNPTALVPNVYAVSNKPLYTISGIWMEKYLSNTSQLWCTGYNIPSTGKKILGIELILDMQRNARIEDLIIQLTYSGSLIGNNKASTVNPAQTDIYTGNAIDLPQPVGDYHIYGSGSDVWGLDAPLTTFTPTELLTNGDFGTGDFTGWTLGISAGINIDLVSALSGVPTLSAQYVIGGGRVSQLGLISQTVSCNFGDNLVVSFYSYNFNAPEELKVTMTNIQGNQVLLDENNVLLNTWQYHEFHVTTTDTTTTLTFGLREDPSYVYIGNVRIITNIPTFLGLAEDQITNSTFGVVLSFRSNQVLPHSDFAYIHQAGLRITYA